MFNFYEGREQEDGEKRCFNFFKADSTIPLLDEKTEDSRGKMVGDPKLYEGGEGV